MGAWASLARKSCPAGLLIGDVLLKNLCDLHRCRGLNWSEEEIREWVKVDRFGLNADFIEANEIPRIDNLETGSGLSLADPAHPDHLRDYVQSYLSTFGEWKCEANALVVRP